MKQNKKEDQSSTGLRALLILFGGFGVFLAILMVLLLGYSLLYSGVVFPGVSIGGVDLSGLTAEQAKVRLAQQLTYSDTGQIVFQDGQNVWAARPADLGLLFDANASAEAAYNLGRQGDPLTRLVAQLGAWYRGRDLPAILVYDERQARNYLGGLAAQVDRPTLEAGLQINGAEVIAAPGQVGRQLDIAATLQVLQNQVRSLTDGLVPLVVAETPPQIMDVSQQAETARQILSAPLTLQVPDAAEGDPGPWVFEPNTLGEMLVVERVDTPQGPQVQVVLQKTKLRQLLQEQTSKLARGAANARFVFNDDTRQLEVLQPAVIGRDLDLEASLVSINERLMQGEHTIPLVVTYTQPQVGSEATAEQLGITQLVSSHTSYFRGSSASRIHNIETAASRFHGVLVPPGATFSMAETMGDVSLDTGYSEALIIYGGRTIEGVGGGVCQVSTTLFRTAFLAGFPIVERNPHAYRVGYYEQTASGYDSSLAGMDATVFVPVVDFKFTNDTPYWLLMETYVNPKAGRITWKFYSGSDGRTVEWESSGPQNIVPAPKPRYEENSDLAAGEIEQVDYEADGADVTVRRIVYRDGQVLFTDTFHTHYEPWQAIYQYGPGTNIPGN